MRVKECVKERKREREREGERERRMSVLCQHVPTCRTGLFAERTLALFTLNFIACIASASVHHTLV